MGKKDPYKYFRIESAELSDALKQGFAEIQKMGPSRDLVARLLRYAHTLKGAARVVRATAVADISHSIEEALSPFRESTSSLPRESIEGLNRLLLSLGDKLAELDQPEEKQRSTTQASSPVRRLDTVHLEVGEVDNLLQRLTGAASSLAQLQQESSGLDRIARQARKLVERLDGASLQKLRNDAEDVVDWLQQYQRQAVVALERAERDLRQAYESAGRLRLLPASHLFEFLERAARDAAQSLRKTIRFEASGGDHRLDAPVLLALQEALLHIVRNAVAHGLEDESVRISYGKPAVGTVQLEVSRRGNRVLFRCRDDGRGFDLSAIRQAATDRGLLPLSASDPLNLEDAVRILLRGSISTSREVTDVSGRGIGMDVVRETAERLNGEVRITSEPGKGAIVQLAVPYTMSALPALAVESGGMQTLIPFEGVRRTLLASDQLVARSAQGNTILFEDKSLPFLGLDVLLGLHSSRSTYSRPAVVLQAGSDMAVVAVDRILGVKETVALPLPALSVAHEFVAGASMDVEGNPCLVLDLDGLIRSVRNRSADAGRDRPVQRHAILIVDDSLTTRMLEQSILESAGYDVDLAISGEEALLKSRQRKYGLLLVDVEMPGMSGFQLLDEMRQDAALRDIPAILVTSRSSEEDKMRGEAAGARDYITKAEFDQRRLLARIKEIIT